MESMLQKALELFHQTFGTAPELVAHAPGRVNLIGEHTDYNDGFVFPAAIDRGLTVAASVTTGESSMVSAVQGQGEGFDATSACPGSVNGWAAYPAGVAWALRGGGALPNMKAAVVSDLPTGSGLSSSAAIELAFAVLWNEFAGLSLSNKDLALLCQRAENGFVGMNCGVMDQMASALGKADHAVFLDTRDLAVKHVPLPDSLSIVVCDTGKPRALTESAYNERRSQCEEACKVIGVKSLRDATMESLEAAKGRLGELLFRRALHVVSENIRAQDFVNALIGDDTDQVGSLMEGSHLSLRNNYQVSCIELDSMVESVIHIEGCIGARMTGAGFGGACVALVRTDDVEAFAIKAESNYRARVMGSTPAFIACKAVDGARIVA